MQYAIFHLFQAVHLLGRREDLTHGSYEVGSLCASDQNVRSQTSHFPLASSNSYQIHGPKRPSISSTAAILRRRSYFSARIMDWRVWRHSTETAEAMIASRTVWCLLIYLYLHGLGNVSSTNVLLWRVSAVIDRFLQRVIFTDCAQCNVESTTKRNDSTV